MDRIKAPEWAIEPPHKGFISRNGEKIANLERLASFGRSKEASVLIDHSSVSKIHAILFYGSKDGETGYFIQDVGSKNGTFVGALDSPHRLRLPKGGYKLIDKTTCFGFGAHPKLFSLEVEQRAVVAVVEPVQSANRWEKASLGDDSRTDKFQKLMGFSRATLSDTGKPLNGHAASVKKSHAEIHNDLEKTFNRSMMARMSGGGKKGLGFGAFGDSKLLSKGKNVKKFGPPQKKRRL